MSQNVPKRNRLLDDTTTKVIAVLGSRGGSGTTTVALSLAKEYAKQSKYVLYVDFNLDNPIAWRYLGVPAKSLSKDVITALSRHELVIDEVLTKTDNGRIKLVSSSELTSLVQSLSVSLETCSELIKVATTRFDVIIIDCDPCVYTEGTAAALINSNYTIMVTEPDINLLPRIAKLKEYSKMLAGRDKLDVLVQNRCVNRVFDKKLLASVGMTSLGEIYYSEQIASNSRINQITNVKQRSDENYSEVINSIMQYIRTAI